MSSAPAQFLCVEGLKIDAVLDLTDGANFWFALTPERWFSWGDSNPEIEAEPNTIKFAWSGYEKRVVVADGLPREPARWE